MFYLLGSWVCLHAGVGCCIWGGWSQLCADIYQGARFSYSVCWLSAGTKSVHRHPSLGDDCCITTLRQDGATGHFTAILYWISVLPSEARRSFCKWIIYLDTITKSCNPAHLVLVPNQDKLGGLWQKRHPVKKWWRWWIGSPRKMLWECVSPHVSGSMLEHHVGPRVVCRFLRAQCHAE